MKHIGFIGLGVMGLPMAANLAKKSGLPVTGFDVSEDRRRMLMEAGAAATAEPETIYSQCDVIFLCLPTNELLDATVRRVVECAKPGAIIVDLGSSAPGVVRELETLVREKGMHLVDSPVSGGETGAKAGTLVLMCGGDETVFNTVRPLLLHMGSSATYMGKSGCGSVAKIANNMMVGIHLGALGEAFAFAAKAGLDPAVLFNAIKDGFAGSAVMTLKAPKIIDRDFSASARVAVHQKDLKNADRLASEMGVDIPLSRKILADMNRLEAEGRVNEDHCAVARIYEQDMGVEIKSGARG